MTLVLLLAAPLLLVPPVPVPTTSPPVRKWTETAEAVFLTKDEARAWKTLADDDARARFISDYWARRDPKPETPENEFRDLVAKRIGEADTRFGLGRKAGSETARGHVYVLLGPPASMTQTLGPLDQTPRMGASGQLELPDTAFQNREWHAWTYDATTPDVVAAAQRPVVEAKFIVNPGRNDELQYPGWLEPIRLKLADASINRRVAGATP